MSEWLRLSLLNLGVTSVMAVQANFYFNSVFGQGKSRPGKPYWIAIFVLLTFAYLTFDFTDVWSSVLALTIMLVFAQGYGVPQKLKVMFAILYTVLLTLVNLIMVYLLNPTLYSASQENGTVPERATAIPARVPLCAGVLMRAAHQHLSGERVYLVQREKHSLFPGYIRLYRAERAGRVRAGRDECEVPAGAAK